MHNVLHIKRERNLGIWHTHKIPLSTSKHLVRYWWALKLWCCFTSLEATSDSDICYIGYSLWADFWLPCCMTLFSHIVVSHTAVVLKKDDHLSSFFQDQSLFVCVTERSPIHVFWHVLHAFALLFHRLVVVRLYGSQTTKSDFHRISNSLLSSTNPSEYPSILYCIPQSITTHEHTS